MALTMTLCVICEALLDFLFIISSHPDFVLHDIPELQILKGNDTGILQEVPVATVAK